MNPPNRNESLWTSGALIAWATEDFARRDLQDARLSAEVLLAHAMGTDRVGLYLRHDELVDGPALDRFRSLVAARRDGSPVAYLTGTREFYSIPLAIDGRVLIPRPETELLVDEVLCALKEQVSPSVVDVGTGSGAVALAIKMHRPDAQVTATDIDPGALDVARANAERHGVQIDILEGDLLDATSGAFDAVVANLPYVPSSDLSALPPDVRDYEPVTALDGGEDGLDLIRRLVCQAARFGCAGVFLEIGAGQGPQVLSILKASGFVPEALRKDFAGIPRVAIGRRGA